MGWGEVETDVFMVRQPAIIFGFVSIEIVQNDVNVASRVVGDDAVHEVQELDPPTALVMAGLDQPVGHLQRRKQGRGAVPLVLMVKAGQRLAIGQLQPALGAFESLDVRLLIDRQDDRVLRRLQVKPNDVRGFWCKLRIGADAPAPSPLQRYLVLPQHPPNLVLGDVAQVLGQQRAVPARIALGRRRVQRCQNSPLVLATVVPRLAAACRIGNPGQAAADKPATPLADRCRAGCQPLRHLLVAQPVGHSQNDPRSKRQALLGLRGRLPRLQPRPLLACQHHLDRFHSGNIPHTLTFATRY